MKYADIECEDPRDSFRVTDDSMMTRLLRYDAEDKGGPEDVFGNRLPIPGGSWLHWNGACLVCWGPLSMPCYKAHDRRNLLDAMIAFPDEYEAEALPDVEALTDGDSPLWAHVPVMECP